MSITVADECTIYLPYGAHHLQGIPYDMSNYYKFYEVRAKNKKMQSKLHYPVLNNSGL